ncbi:leucine-rich repeat protein [Ruminococcus flavefaciens]|uniref:leucine-rich repeat protein n=1 Tax=Ruminococcus flavefaciens TaxID=1265 RepID=UPI00048BA946|nr:leucine-rich repeat protein [Ruminococcus flavefaciens]
MKIKGFISLLAALTVITSSVAAVPFSASAEVVSETEIAAEYDFSGVSSTVEKDGVSYSIFKGYAAVHYVNDENIEEFTVPETINDVPVVGIEWGAFRNCKNIKKLTLTKNVSVINWGDIAEFSMEEIAVTEDNESFTVVDGVLYSKDMKTVVAFPPSNSAAEVKIADEAENIAPYAFVSCQKLTKIEVSNNVGEIGEGAFVGCTSLTSINIPDGVKAINTYTFAGTKALKGVRIPGSVDYMYNDAFKDSGAIENEGGIHYVDKWAVGADNDIERADIRMGTVGTMEGLFVSKNKLRVVTVPDSVIHLGSYLVFGLYTPVELVEFHCPAIPARVLGCLSVKEVWIYDRNCKIEDDASSLPTYWREPKEAPEEEETTEENDYIIRHTRVTASSSSGANSIAKVINTSLTEIDEEDDDAGEITTITHSVNTSSTDSKFKEKVEAYMEKYREKLSQNTEDNSGVAVAQPVEKVYKSPIKIGNPAKYDTIIRGFERSTAEEYALKYRRVFDTFEPASTVVGPESVTDHENSDIEYRVYGNSYAIASLRDGYHPDGSNRKKEITIAEEINGVPVTAYRLGGGDADIIHLPKTVSTILYSVDVATSYNCSYDIDKDNPYLTSVDGIIYSKDMTKLIKVPSRYEGKKIVVPDGVKSIEDFAMLNLRNVESIELPDSLEEIKYGAFLDATKLKSINLPENLDFIGDRAFNYCISLEDIKIPESVKGIGLYAFYDVPAVNYEGGLGYLDNWLVEAEADDKPNMIVPKEGITGMARVCAKDSLVIPKSVTKMGWEVLGLYNSITRADVYSHVIDYDAFKNARYLKDIYIYDPECEICAGDQTIPAKYIDTDNRVIKKFDELVPDIKSLNARTYAYELKAGDGEKLGDTVIHGYKGSTAEAYAQMYGIKFEALDNTAIYKDGDLNGDGQFNVGDLVLMNRYIHGTYTFNEKQYKSADLNGDGNADVFDVIEFRKKILAD